jgi:hypothetical protein
MNKIWKEGGLPPSDFILTILFILSANLWRNLNPRNLCNPWSKFCVPCGNSISVHQRLNWFRVFRGCEGPASGWRNEFGE